jgi:hypothetical protein
MVRLILVGAKMLKRNTRNAFSNPGPYTGIYSYQFGNYFNGGKRAIFTAFSPRSSYPASGNLAPNAFVLPQTPGDMASFTLSRPKLIPNVSLTPGMPMVADASATLVNINAQLDQIVSAIASSNIALTALNTTLAGAANAQASSVATLAKLDALCGAIFSVDANGTFVLSKNVELSALGFMIATAGGPPELSPEGLSLELLDTQLVENGLSVRQALKLISAAMAGKVSGAGTSSVTIRNVGDTKDRIVATVDSNGNRTNVTVDAT